MLLVHLLAQRARLTLSEKGCLSSPVVAALIGRADVQTAVLAPRSAPAVALREPSPYRGKGDDGARRGGHRPTRIDDAETRVVEMERAAVVVAGDERACARGAG